MTAGQVVAVVALLAQMYQAPAPLMECMSWHESRHDLEAQAARDAEVRGAVYKLGVGTGASRDRGRFESCWRHRGATQNLREEVSGASAD